MTVPLPLPDDPRLRALVEEWLDGKWIDAPWPRSKWLHDLEAVLRQHYPRCKL